MAATGTSDDLRKLIRRFDASCVRHFQGATSLCVSRRHFEVGPDHLLLRLLDETAGDVTQIFNTFRVDRAPIRRALQRILEELPTGHKGRPALSPKLIELFQSAAVMADEFGFDEIRTGLLILAYVLNPDHTRIGEYTPEFDRIDVDQLRDHFHEIVLGSTESAAMRGEAIERGGPPMEGGALEKFTVDLTAKAAAGEIDPVFGREHEIRQMIDIFARRRKNNPILVGEPGTGKTAIVEGLALRIADGDVPPTLRGVKLICLDMGLLQAGASVKGEFENRLKNVIREIKASETPIITFIDEAHQMIGAGGAAGGSDAANLLKPALARGELRTCAATTWAEYKKYFEKDAALERRFQLVRCDEPSVEDAVVMLRGLKDRYEKHHKVFVLDEAVWAAVSLSKRYLSGRFLPDKAVDLLDTSAARVSVGLGTRPGALDDYDRQLNNLDTAIAAMKRDRAGGVTIDEGALAEMEANRTETLDAREKVEERWKAELEVVNRIRELRARLRGGGDGDGDGKDAGAKKGQAKAETKGSEQAEKVGTPATPGSEAGGVRPDQGRGPLEEKAAAPVDEAGLRAEIDDAMAALREIQGEHPLVHPQVDGAAVASIVSDWTGIPVGSMVKDEVAAILEMEDRLRTRVVGQDHALKTVAEKLRTNRAGIGNPTQPMGVFLCVGPSGVGKTELALAVADLLFGGDQFLTSINMSEFMEKHTVSQLKGSPPGYVGYGEGGVLTEAVRQHPYSVVLLDEVEKAHPDVMNLFYQVFDKGSLADGEGRVINFKNTVLFLTSNLGTDVIQNMCESGEDLDINDLKEGIYPHLREHFKPALVARMTVIPFLTLGNDILKTIARMKLKKVVDRLAQAHKIKLNADDAVYEQMAEQCNQVDLGARQIDHLLDRVVLPELSRRLLEEMGGETMPSEVTMAAGEEGAFTYAFS
ncbi:MAG: type VI secretion system ATPase TssH [Phycisphaerae bacterium]|nr:type VI secretion system ATPase TssH [Phycisphaerae bacterium]